MGWVNPETRPNRPKKIEVKKPNIYLNIFLWVKYVFGPINIPTFRFRPSKIFLQLLVPIKFSITTFGP